MDKNLERRKSVRIDQTSPLTVKSLRSGKICKARMFNFSKNGLYFESDSVLQTGDQIYIGIQDSPFASRSGVLEYYRAEIKWHKKLKDSYFEYGYGIELGAAGNKHRSKTEESRDNAKPQQNKKDPNRQTIKIFYQNRTCAGIVKDISSSGVFFVAEEPFHEGQVLTFELPSKKGTKAHIDGQIVWVDDKGVGVVFINASETA